jgi:hypothetical protein
MIFNHGWTRINTDSKTGSSKMKRNAETQRTRSNAELLGVRREAKRHAAFVRAGRAECSLRFVRAKPVSLLRSATAVQDALGAKEIRSRVRK